tara:strand:- start:478 stop:690 length:213 start_codon:yes stop_codon:yes gene_type:complete
MSKEYNWREADWTNPEDHSIDEHTADRLEKCVANLPDHSPFKNSCTRGSELFDFVCKQPHFKKLTKKELN